MTITEIATFNASKAYLDNPDILRPALDLLSKVAGVVNLWTGIRVEDGKTGYLFVGQLAPYLFSAFPYNPGEETDWESHEHVQNWPSSPDFEKFVELGKPAFSAPPTISLVSFAPSPDDALNAPVTEVCTCKYSDEIKPALLDLIAVLSKQLDAVEGCFGPTGGELKPDGHAIVLLIGWDTIQTHIDTVKDDDGVKQLLSIADIELFHTPLKRYAAAT